MPYFNRLQTMAAKRPVLSLEGTEPRRPVARVPDMAREEVHETPSSPPSTAEAPASRMGEVLARPQVRSESASPAESVPGTPGVMVEQGTVRAEVVPRGREYSSLADATLPVGQKLEKPDLAGAAERSPKTFGIAEDDAPASVESTTHRTVAAGAKEDTASLASERPASAGSVAPRLPAVDVELEALSPTPVSGPVTEPDRVESREPRREERPGEALADLQSFGEALSLVRRWMSEPASDDAGSQTTPAKETAIRTPAELAPQKTPDAPLAPLVSPRVAPAPVAVDSQPREEHVELSIGTVHITVEEAQTPPRPSKPGTTRGSRRTATDPMDRHYLRGW